ncbi:MAG: hypothetical protein HMLKMBBP_03401 [Planctomycetes bacterium]|nr:hypothetical protein [Planctomycetota bacterium]
MTGVAGSPGGIERRSAPRVAPSEPCAAELVEGGRAAGRVRDVSPGGVGLEFGAGELATESGVLLRLTWSRAESTVRGRVVWIVREGGSVRAGVRIDDPVPAGALPVLLDLAAVRIDPAWALRVPAPVAMRRRLLAFAASAGRVHVACEPGTGESSLRAIERHFDLPLVAEPAEPRSLRDALRRVYGDAAGAADPADPVAVCDEILRAAWLRRASDIHLDPDARSVRVRFRVDGELEDWRRIDGAIQQELSGRIKVLAGMDIAERRAPQDGRFSSVIGGEEVEFRAATLPTRHGERFALRLLAARTQPITLARLGMSARDLEAYDRAIARPHGLILATGPTGCGKSTTLFAGLEQVISRRPVNAIAVQDPVEYDIPGVAQVEVDPAQKVTFARALRSILRHDPDVLMIGEIRDGETVDIALKAALTGHLVLATLHTNSAASVVTRLSDMGVPRFLTASTLRLVVSQRLARRLCPHCRAAATVSAVSAAAFGRPEAAGSPAFEPVGCAYCAGRGHNGRIGIFEVAEFDDALSRQVAEGAHETAVADALRTRGAPSLADDALAKVAAGCISVDDALASVAC